MQAPNYRISPSLLNKLWDLVNSDVLYDQFYGTSETTEVTPEDFYLKQEQELLDAINRVEKEPMEAADRGTCLNEAVDCILERRLPQEGIALRTVRDPDGQPQSILAQMHGFDFNFDANLCLELAAYYRGSLCQHLCEAIIDTSLGPVILYGYSDYIRRDVVYDLKTTGNYSYGKYEDGFQKDLYPWCLIESCELGSVSGFEYTAVKLSGGNTKDPLIRGEVFREWYDYDHKRAGERLVWGCEMLIEWIELHRDLITHKRIFNQ